jgi:Right handed beta helix region
MKRSLLKGLGTFGLVTILGMGGGLMNHEIAHASTPPLITTCPPATITVHDSEELATALEQARAGDRIWLEDGIYTGRFVATASGTKASPIFLCGDVAAILDGDGINGGYVFHLDDGDYWRLVGFTLRNGQKGIVADTTQGSIFQALTIEDIGDEALHLRTHSTDNLVIGNIIRRTGLRRDKFGEGIYIGSAESNWCKYTNCQPDASHRNVIQDNTISATTAESVDIKEGTVGGSVTGNSFDGSMLSGADSWVDVKGNEWIITGNTGRNSPEDGFQTHETIKGWGTKNVFKDNIAMPNGPGYGFHLTPIAENVVGCDNRVIGAAQGLTNTTCE